MVAVGCNSCSQFLYAVFERPLKLSVAPKIADTTDPWLVERELPSETRRLLEERKRDTGLESNDAEGDTFITGPLFSTFCFRKN